MSEIRTDTINNASGDNDSGIDLSTNDQVDIKIAGSVKARVDSSGNLLVGTTDDNPANDTSGSGIALRSDGIVGLAATNTIALRANRTGNDGSIISAYRDGALVGNLGSQNGSDFYISSKLSINTGLRFQTDEIVPVDNAGGNRDNAIDLGKSNIRFDDIFATNGTIQTSDQNEKNTITDSDLGIDFIKRLTPKSYIFNGKTRTHYGLIAQDVETVLTDISKPTSGFAGFIKDDISEEQDGSEYRYGLRYTEFVAPLIQAVKDQQATIDGKQATITELEARITALESE